MSNIIRLGGGGGDLDQIQFTANGDYYAEDYGIDGFYACYVRVPAAQLDEIRITANGEYLASNYGIDGFNKVTVEAGGGYTEELTIVFGSTIVGETWTVEATGTGAAAESYTGTVDSTQTATVTLTQASTEYTITCAGATAYYTTGGVDTLNFSDAMKIINGMTSLQMNDYSYTDSYGITYNATASSENGGRAAWRPFVQTFTGEPWQCLGSGAGWVQLQISKPCKIKTFEITIASGSSNFNDLLFQGSNDGETWVTLHVFTAEELTKGTAHEITGINGSAYNYYRWYTSVGWDRRIQQIKFTKVTG